MWNYKLTFAPKLKGFYISRRPWDEKLLWPPFVKLKMWFGLSDPCTVCYSVDTTTEHSPLKSSEKGMWWHLIRFFKPPFIVDLWMIILLHLWNRRAFCLLRMAWIMLAWKTTIDGFHSDVIRLQSQKKARFYEFWFTLGWR